MLTEQDYQSIKEELDSSHRPLFFFDDDPDGLCSFLQFYRYKSDGKGILVKTHPKLDLTLLPKVEEYAPDKVFILDVPLVEKEFLEKCKTPTVWIDHHTPTEHGKARYFNPRSKGSSHLPTSLLCYNTLKQDLWLAAVGIVADWFFTPEVDAFRKQYPDLLPPEIATAPDALYSSRLGQLVRIFSFLLKGTTSDAMKYIKVLTRIAGPHEILDQTTAQGKFIFKRYEAINRHYEELLKLAKKHSRTKGILLFIYEEDMMSFSSDLSNELIYRYPDKLVVVGRRKGGEVKGSIRTTKKINLPEHIQKALVGSRGYGGGHEQACGFCVKEEDFEKFVENLRRETQC